MERTINNSGLRIVVWLCVWIVLPFPFTFGLLLLPKHGAYVAIYLSSFLVVCVLLNIMIARSIRQVFSICDISGQHPLLRKDVIFAKRTIKSHTWANLVECELRTTSLSSKGNSPGAVEYRLVGVFDDGKKEEIASTGSLFSMGRDGLEQIRNEWKALWGHVDDNGCYLFRQEFMDSVCFSEGLMPVVIQTNVGLRWGYVDSNGKICIPPKFTEARPFVEGRSVVRFRKKYGYIDETGSIVIPCIYDGAQDFSNGEAAIRKGHDEGFIKRYALIDKDGRLVEKGNSRVVSENDIEQSIWEVGE